MSKKRKKRLENSAGDCDGRPLIEAERIASKKDAICSRPLQRIDFERRQFVDEVVHFVVLSDHIIRSAHRPPRAQVEWPIVACTVSSSRRIKARARETHSSSTSESSARTRRALLALKSRPKPDANARPITDMSSSPLTAKRNPCLEVNQPQSRNRRKQRVRRKQHKQHSVRANSKLLCLSRVSVRTQAIGCGCGCSCRI